MAENVYFFDEGTAERVVAATELSEQANPHKNYHAPRYGSPTRGMPPEVQVVRVSSATLGAHGYPGFIGILHVPVADPPTFDDGGACWVRDPNGGTLLAQKYLARRTTSATDNSPVFEAMTPGIIIDISSSGTTVSPANKLTFDTNDFVGTNPSTGEFYVKTKGLTATTTKTITGITAVSCSGGTLSVTSGTVATVTLVTQDGLVTSFS